MAAHNSLVILGAGGSARETWWFARDVDPELRIVFVDDVGDATEVRIADEVVPVVKDWSFSSVRENGAVAFREFIVGVAEPRIKRLLVSRALASGLVPAATLIHPRTLVRGDCRLGRGGQIVAHSQLTTNVTLGNYVCVLDTTIGHHDVVGDYTTCFPGCKVSGDVTLGEDCLLGAGTIVRPGVSLARGTITGAGACVVKDCPEPDRTWVGVPARPIGSAPALS